MKLSVVMLAPNDTSSGAQPNMSAMAARASRMIWSVSSVVAKKPCVLLLWSTR